MSIEQYHANRMFGKRPEQLVGFKAKAHHLLGQLFQLLAWAAIALAVALPIYNAGKEDAREKIFRQLNRLEEDPQLLHDYIRDGGY
jgi:hypothetical protein